jgi:hypothetical protein
MSDISPGPGWWLASDLRWYPPEVHPDYVPPRPGWWLASDWKWYPPALRPGPAAARLLPPEEPAPAPPPGLFAEPEGSRQHLAMRFSDSKRWRVLAAAVVAVFVATLTGTVVTLTGTARRSSPPSVAAGARAGSGASSRNDSGTSPQGSVPTGGSDGQSQAPSASSPPSPAPTTTVPPATIPPASAPLNTSTATTPQVVGPVTAAASSKPATGGTCPSGNVHSSVTASIQQAANQQWTVDLTGSLQNGTTSGISPASMTVQVLGPDGTLLDTAHLSPDGAANLSPGQSGNFSGSDQVSSAGEPDLGQELAQWNWVNPAQVSCPS